ncbi:chromosome segregation ATPase [Symbiobacterium terraclitae]|uniref:Chromosome segregation ATPase n=1 Tax=Symbiobacterium terraclitae TaxID=557451 RepID=A0ABS4JVN3_9FIRM|nr:hypothetical protein [Symbiobacterium terraclitae]MBP2018484.1 chromosome segregation ATPase [Symbiobacterium terraclitae]
MPDIPFFDAIGFFAQKLQEVEQQLIAKKAEREILLANQASLEQTLATLALLSPEHQKAIQQEVASLKEVLHTTERNLTSLEGEIDMLNAKLNALKTARDLLHVEGTP